MSRKKSAKIAGTDSSLGKGRPTEHQNTLRSPFTGEVFFIAR
jgi:hypothetical protein